MVTISNEYFLHYLAWTETEKRADWRNNLGVGLITELNISAKKYNGKDRFS